MLLQCPAIPGWLYDPVYYAARLGAYTLPVALIVFAVLLIRQVRIARRHAR